MRTMLRTRALNILLLLTVVALALSAYSLVQISASVDAQVANRAANVWSWCSGINAGRNYDRAFIASVTHGRLHYTLRDLDCKALVAKTLKSAQH